MAKNVETCVLDRLDIDISRYFSSNEISFASELQVVSLDSQFFYRRTTPIDFTPMVKKMREDKVRMIRVLKLPSERVKINKKVDEVNKGYISILEPLLDFCTVGEICCAFIRDDDVDILLNILELISKKSRDDIAIRITKMNPYDVVDVTKAVGNSKRVITLKVKERSKDKFKVQSSCKSVRIVSAKEDDISAEDIPTNAVTIFSSGGRYQDRAQSISLFFDSVPSSNLYEQDHGYKHVNIAKSWEQIDQFASAKDVNMERGLLSSCEDPVTIAILDTGILSTHTVFKREDEGSKGFGKILKVKNFVPASYGPYENDEYLDRNGHGTHCASIAAGGSFTAWRPDGNQGSGLPAVDCGTLECGVAPFARLVVGKIATTWGFSKPEWMADALDWIVRLEDEEHIKVDIISLSVGYGKFSKRLFNSICNALMAGKIIVCASSNDGKRQQTNIAFPARFGNVLCVGSHSKKGQPSEFSPNGREIDVLAPGEDVWAALSANDKAVFPFSGTSAATPFVAGVCALILVAAQRLGGKALREDVSNTSVMREILRKMATKPGHHDESMGYGNVDPWNVFNYGKSYFKKIIDDVLEKEED